MVNQYTALLNTVYKLLYWEASSILMNNQLPSTNTKISYKTSMLMVKNGDNDVSPLLCPGHWIAVDITVTVIM